MIFNRLSMFFYNRGKMAEYDFLRKKYDFCN